MALFPHWERRFHPHKQPKTFFLKEKTGFIRLKTTDIGLAHVGG